MMNLFPPVYFNLRLYHFMCCYGVSHGLNALVIGVSHNAYALFNSIRALLDPLILSQCMWIEVKNELIYKPWRES